MENQPSLLEEEWEGVSMQVEDFENEAMAMMNTAAQVKEKRNSFFKAFGAEVMDVFGMGKENMPATAS
jgi:hypothetical protein